MSAGEFLLEPPLAALELFQFEPVRDFLVVRQCGLKRIGAGFVAALYDHQNERYRVTVTDLDTGASWSWATGDTNRFRQLWRIHGGFEVGERFEQLLRVHERQPWRTK